MYTKIASYSRSHKVISVVVTLLIFGGGYFAFQRIGGNIVTVQYVSAEVQKGTIVSSVSGSGQINVSDQIDITPGVSGKIATIYVTKGQEVRWGSILAILDVQDAERAVSDAEIALESANIQLEELLAGADAQSVLSAENAFAEAERDLERAKRDYENIDADVEQTLATAYEDGYSDVATSFFKLSDYMQDLRDVLGTEDDAQTHVISYKLLLGENALVIRNLLNNYAKANDAYSKNFTFFREVSRDDERDIVYQLINDTLESTKAIARALEDARHMYDAIVERSYTQYNISVTIGQMQPKIESDLSAVFSTITALQNTINTIDATVEDTPDKIKDSELALKSAEEALENKRIALEELQRGADSLDIRTQQNIVAQREAALSNMKEELASHYIRAPFDGIIAEIDISRGDSVSSGSTLATLMTQVQIAELMLNEVDIAQVKLNQLATLTFDAVDGLTLTGKVTDIDNIASTNQGVVTYGVTITIDTTSDLIKPGMTTDVSIITDKKSDVLFVPNSAVKTQGGGNMFVEILEDDVPSERIVDVGLSNDEVTEIVSGLQVGENVVTAVLSGDTQASVSTGGSNLGIPGLGGGGRGGFRGRGF